MIIPCFAQQACRAPQSPWMKCYLCRGQRSYLTSQAQRPSSPLPFSDSAEFPHPSLELPNPSSLISTMSLILQKHRLKLQIVYKTILGIVKLKGCFYKWSWSTSLLQKKRNLLHVEESELDESNIWHLFG